MPTNLQVPYVNLAGQHRAMKTELLEAVGRTLEEGQFILGPVVSAFEKRFAELCGVKFAIGVGNGTDALELALRALDVGPGSEVITAPNSFIASAAAIAMVGAKPAFVDVGEDYNLDPRKLSAAITSRTKAIMPVHLTGRPADMTQIGQIAAERGIPVVEDAAQAVLAEHCGQRVGSFGAAGCFSLHPLKTLNACGDGGVITTNDALLAEKLMVLRNIGLRTRDDCVVWSGNSRLDSIQAAILLVKLRYVEQWTEARRANASFYQKALSGIPDLSTPSDRPDERAVYHTFVIQTPRRDELKAFLQSRGIETSIHYPVPIHLSRAAAELRLGPGSFPVTERQAGRVLSLPVFPELTQQQRELVAATIREFFARG